MPCLVDFVNHRWPVGFGEKCFGGDLFLFTHFEGTDRRLVHAARRRVEARVCTNSTQDGRQLCQNSVRLFRYRGACLRLQGNQLRQHS